MSDNIIHVTNDSFEKDVLSSDLPVLVDYWAEWCGPCKLITPLLDDISRDYADRLKVAKLNIDENRETAEKFNIKGIPTLMIFKDGAIVDQRVGALRKPELKAFIDKHI